MTVTAPAGFVASGSACGIKQSGDPDLALVATEDRNPVPAAGVFTDNKAAAAPVVLSRAHLEATGGRAGAVVVTSGNANAATGARGGEDAKRICRVTGSLLGVAPEEVLLCQTGLIGIPLPMECIEPGIGELVRSAGTGREPAKSAATAMMTTDTMCKEVVVEGLGCAVGGMAKGAAMLAPNMATMLAVLTTDAACSPGGLRQALADAVAGSFNALSVDGCTSTNDTVLALASGRSGVTLEKKKLTGLLSEACGQLAMMMASDAEGATKVVRIDVVSAKSEEEARKAARKVGESLLVKCSLNGGDPYWGRIVSELGSAQVAFDLSRTEVSYGGVTVCREGVAIPHDERSVREHLAGDRVSITCSLNTGTASASIIACDLGYGYIDENRTTS